MQISRCFLIGCVATGFLFPSMLLSADTAAQIKARQALEQKLQSAPSQPMTATPAASSNLPVAAGPVLAAPKPSNPQDIEKAREALRKAMGTPAPAAAPMRPSQPAQVAPMATPSMTMPPVAGPAPSNPQDIEKAREALRQSLRSTQPQPVVTAPVVTPPRMTAPTVSAPAVAMPTPADEQKLEKAREALRQKLNENSQPMTQAPSAYEPGAAPSAIFSPIPQPADPQAAEKAREALRQTMIATPKPQPVHAPAVVTRPATKPQPQASKPTPVAGKAAEQAQRKWHSQKSRSRRPSSGTGSV